MENLGNKEYEALWNVLANPADVNYAYTVDVKSLVDQYPQSGILRALLAGNGNQQSVNHAVTYFDPATLYKIVHAPDSLQSITPDQIAWIDKPLSERGTASASLPVMEDLPAALKVEPSPYLNDYEQVDEAEESVQTYTPYDETVADVEEEIHYNPFANLEPIDQSVGNGTETAYPTEPEPIAESTVAEEETPKYITPEPAPVPVEETVAIPAEKPADDIEFVWPPRTDDDEDEVHTTHESETSPANTDHTEYFHRDIDDEIYDEIVSIEDINLEQLAAYQAEVEVFKPVEHEHLTATTDHFVFEPEAVKNQESETSTSIIAESAQVETISKIDEETSAANRNHDVSKYYDEKLPYTFMWWLDKTRREHAAIYQPYVYYNRTPARQIVSQPVVSQPKKTKPDELQQQYVENIFNINAIDELERYQPIKPEERPVERKEDQIIKRFIETEPQIKHPGNIRLDNENKAKKSSEDADEFVTETLARIYTEQMLYQKAITTYKKLMLKFPEKSLYFAGQIEQLEKKPN
ncbi:MAG: hypothetical protein ACXVAY_05115 [Mucilaginibacter sp.]